MVKHEKHGSTHTAKKERGMAHEHEVMKRQKERHEKSKPSHKEGHKRGK